MTAIVTDAHYRMSVSLIRDLFDRGVRVAACEKASIEAPVGFASRGTAQCIRLPDEEYEAALLALCREVLEIEGEKPVLLPVGAKTLAMVSRSRDAFSAVAGLCAATPSQLRFSMTRLPFPRWQKRSVFRFRRASSVSRRKRTSRFSPACRFPARSSRTAAKASV